MSKFLALTFLLTVALVDAATAQTQTTAKPLGVGDKAPDFTLVDHRGQKVTLSDSKGRNPVVLVFYRGYW